MNLIAFLKQTDDILSGMTQKDMTVFIRNQAVSTPEEKRAAFLSALKQAAGAKTPAADSSTEQKSLKERAELAMEELDALSDSDKELDSSYREEYDDRGRWGDWGTYKFTDPDGILEVIEDDCSLVHALVDAELYREAYDLCRKLMALEISVTGDYAVYVEPMIDLSDLANYVSDIPYEDLLLDGALGAYDASDSADKRAESIWDILSTESIELEKLEERAEGNLPDYRAFLEAYSRVLLKKQGTYAGKELALVLEKTEDPALTLETAKEGAAVHPEIYLSYIESLKTPDEIMAAARDALSRITDESKKAEIASLAAGAARKTGNREDLAYFLFEEFKADPEMDTCLHFIREFPGRNTQEIGRIIAGVSGLRRYALAFLEKDFDTVLNQGMSAEKSSDWSSTFTSFMKEGISLFLIYFMRGKGLPSDVSGLFSHLRPMTSRRSDDLQELFLWWKAENPPEAALIDRVLPKLEQWIDRRTDAVMKENQRYYYRECAGFTAALGEVEQSLGRRTKAEVLAMAADRYPARRNYIAELKNHGYVREKKRR